MAETTYKVTFDRVGRNHNVAPLEATVIHDEELAERIYKHARPHLGSRFIEVEVDLDEMRGWIVCGMRIGGTFTLAECASAERGRQTDG